MAAGWSIGGSLGGWMTDSMISNATVLNVGQYSAGPSMTGAVPAGRVGGANAPLVSKAEFVQQNQPPVEEAGVIVQEGTGIFAPPTAVLGEGIGPMAGGYTAPVTTMDNMSLSAGDYIGTGGQVNAPLNYNAPLTSIGTAASNPAAAPTGVGTVNTTIPSYTYTSPVITNNTGIDNMPLEGDVTPAQRAAAEAKAAAEAAKETPEQKLAKEANEAAKAESDKVIRDRAAAQAAAPTSNPIGGFNPEKMLEAVNKLPAVASGDTKITYNPTTGNYTLTGFGASFEKTPAELAKIAELNMDDFQSMAATTDAGIATAAGDIQQIDELAGVEAPKAVEAVKNTLTEGEVAADTTAQEVTAQTYEAAKAGETAPTGAAIGAVSPEAVAKVEEQKALTKEAVAAGRDLAAEEAAKGVAAARPEAKDYLVQQLETDPNYVLEMSTGSRPEDMRYDFNGDGRITSADAFALLKDPTLAKYKSGITGVATKVEEVEGPKVTTREGLIIGEEEKAGLLNLAKERGVNVEDLPEYKLAQERTLQVGTAANKEYSDRLGIPPEEVAAQATYYASDFTAEGGPTDISDLPVFKVASQRVAQTGEASTRIAQELGTAPSVDLEGRQAITGTVPQGNAAQIGGVPTLEAATRQAVTGEARSVGAADMLAVVANVPKAVSAALSEDPAKAEAAIDSGKVPNLVAAVAALPQEALVSVQMEQLLAGMEEGKTPAWARPAVAAIEQQMAQRGLTASTVGRDALFNAIIQSALPMAQSNAQALQQRAAQNLSNEQQVNLATAQNTMTIRMQNLANTQTAASQSAQMANEIKLQQGTFKQQAVLTTAEQEQQTALTNAKMAQEKAQQESAQKQQAAVATLNVAAQADLANLQALNAAGSENLSAAQQSKLASYNAQVDRIVRTADLKQDMEKANLSASLQVEMQRISELNAAAKDTMTAEQSERLTNLQTLIDFRKTDATFAQQMDMANMSNDQQMRLANLSEKAATDSANFTAENQFELARLNAVVDRSIRKAELEQRMKEVNLDANLKVELAELSEKNVTSRANMTSEQQTRLANLNVLVDFRKSNAELAQQMDLVNLGNEQQMELANLAERSATDAANFTEANRFRFQELNNHVTIMSQNESLRQNADLARLSTAEKISLSNLTQKNQAASESMSAENVAELQMYEKKMQAGQVNAQLAQQMGLANLSNKQEAAMFNAQMNGNLDMKQMDANQQMAIANSQFMQTMTQTKFSADQQAAMQNAAAMASMDMANIDQRTKLAVENAKSFLAMDMANLDNEQQAIMLDQQMLQQRLLSDQAATNAASQFNATSETQTMQFMSSLKLQADQFNSAQTNAMEQFNVSEANKLSALDSANILEADKFNAQITTSVEQFNANLDYQRDQWNSANAQAIEQANIAWRRNANLADTAAENAANQQSVQNSFALTATSQAQLWQEMRDLAAFDLNVSQADLDRKITVVQSALQNEAFMTSTDTKIVAQRTALFKILDEIGISV